MKQLPIIEIFTSIQGEGMFTGVPSVFVRVSGCNLRCCFKDTICDTPYSSFRPEQALYGTKDVLKELEAHPNVNNVVITGGEPMMYGEALMGLTQAIHDYNPGMIITVETNGTFAPPEGKRMGVTLFSISPKLGTAVAIPGKVYSAVVDGKRETFVFSQEEVERFHKLRYNPEATAEIMKAGAYQLKFVYSGPESLLDIDEFLSDLQRHGARFPGEDIMLMPEGTTPEQITKNGQEAVQVCIERGWRFCDRLHIRLWGDKRGV